MRNIFFVTVLTIFGYIKVWGQQGKEVLVPLQSNSYLQQQEKQQLLANKSSKQAFKIQPVPRFPFAAYFDSIQTTEIPDTLWEIKQVKQQNGWAVFNAQDEAGNTYSSNDGSYGEADVLLSKETEVFSPTGILLFSFGLQEGATRQLNDIISLEVKTPSGNFVSVWQSSSPLPQLTSVSVKVPLNTVDVSAFSFRFKCFTNRSNSNTETYLLRYVSVGYPIEIPFYENANQALLIDPLRPSPLFWQYAQPDIVPSGIDGANAFMFNAFDRFQTLYATTGFGDTLHSQPFDVTTFITSDSVYLRVIYRILPSANTSDSLILEGFSVSQAWQRLAVIVGNTSTSFQALLVHINNNAFNHIDFQFRLRYVGNHSPSDTAQFLVTGLHIGKRVFLPFVDDFSVHQRGLPLLSKWKNQQVFINNTFPILAPSVNAATFDGLDIQGNAYGAGDGLLDELTSQSIRLDQRIAADSVYLSFWVQPTGFGDEPEPNDTLVLQFRNSRLFPESWLTVWKGTAAAFPADKFTEIYVLLDNQYLHDDFQLRFRNYGSRTGNLDHWHLDYVRLDRGRSTRDGFYDFSVQQNPSSLLREYTAMPAKHFLVNPSGFIAGNQTIGLRNNDTIVFPLNFGRRVFDFTETQIAVFNDVQPGVDSKGNASGAITSPVSLNPLGNTDSIIFRAQYFTNQNNTFDNIPTNDTLSIQTVFSNYFAYDDGTAEAGYGIEFESGGAALGYNLTTADTLFGMSIYFNQSQTDVSSLPFNVMVWSAIGTNGNGTGETVLKRIAQSRPTYTNSRNGFYYLKFDNPIALSAGKFYIGWEQTSSFVLNIGFDKNYQINGVPAKNPEMWFKVQDGIWGRTKIEGALMMRPIVGKWIDPPLGLLPSENAKSEKQEVKIYPNPASNKIVVETNFSMPEITLLDLMGKEVYHNNNGEKLLYLPPLPRGIYWLHVVDKEAGKPQTVKLLIE
jgi:hypothetical protein